MIGPLVSDFDSAEFRVVVFGDSFTASAIDGHTWAEMLQEELERATGKKTRVLNMARDGFGVLQMAALAAEALPATKPDLAIFAFNSAAFSRARTWRTMTPEGRFVTTIDPSYPPDMSKSTDMMQIDPRATEAWCRSRAC